MVSIKRSPDSDDDIKPVIHKVTLEVGPEKEKFTIDQAVLCQNSTYFADTFAGASIKDKKFHLQDANAALFNIFVTWMNKNRLIYETPTNGTSVKTAFETLLIDDEIGDVTEYEDLIQDSISPVAHDPTSWPPDVLIRLYIEGDRLGARGFKNAVIDALVGENDQAPDMPSNPAIRFAFANTTDDSPLRKILIHFSAYRHSSRGSDAPWLDLPEKFLAGVTATVVSRLPAKLCDGCHGKAVEGNQIRGAGAAGEDLPPYVKDICAYHEHGGPEERDVCRAEIKKE